MDEQGKQFNWERLGQLGQNTAYAALFYFGAEYAPILMENVYLKQFVTDLLAQAAANTFKNGGDIKKTIESLDFVNAGVKGLFGSRLKIFQEILKTYGDLRIKDGKFDFQPKKISQEAGVELFYRLIFAHLPGPKEEGKRFAWDILKKMTRSEADELTNQVIDETKAYFQSIEQNPKKNTTEDDK